MKTQTNNDILAVVGLDHLGASNSRHFKELVKAVLKETHRIVEVDCSAVKFMDSEGLGALVAVHRLVASRNGHVRLINVQPMVRQLLELLKFQQILEIND